VSELLLTCGYSFLQPGVAGFTPLELMKLKLTPTNISLLAISAFSALVAQELLRTEAKTPNPTPSSDKFKRAQSKLAARATDNPVSALAQPEQLGVKELSTSTISASTKSTSNPKVASKPGQNPSDLAIAELPPPPAPPSFKVTLPAASRAEDPPAPLKVLSVDQLPLDSIVAASLKSGVPSQSKAPATSSDTSSSTVSSSTSSTNSSSTASSSSSPRGLSTASSSGSPSLPKDIQGHRAQSSIQALMQQGVVQGYADGTFRPDAPITDQQYSSMVQKASGKAPTALAGIKRPKDIVTRGDAAAFVYRQMQRAQASNGTLVASAAPTGAAQLPTLASAAMPSLTPVEFNQTTNQPTNQTLPNAAGSNQSAPIESGSRALPPEQIPIQAVPPRPATTSVAMASSLDSYTLGPGDRLQVQVFNVPEYSKEYQVLVNGALNLYRVGNLSVAGMSLKQAEKAISDKYARVLKHPLVDVSLAAARPLNVAVAGEVGRPGSYSLELKDGKFPTVTKLIQEAGGMTRSANPRQVIVRRPQFGGADREITLDLWELFQTGNIRQDLTLLDGDTVFIPTSNGVNLAESSQFAAANFATDASKPINIAVVGEVGRPGPYALEVKAGLPTVTQAIQQAGGINQMANVRKIEVRRPTRAGTTQTIPIDLWKLLKEGDLSQDLVLQQNDTIAIPTATALDIAEASKLGTASFSPGTMKINVVGEVEKPGTVEVASNTPLNQALLAAGGFNNQAKKKSVELIRLNPNGTVVRREIPVDLARGIDEKSNPILQNGDVVVVDRSGAAKFSDSLDKVLGPVGKLLPFRYIFGF
jgi:polysaccharide export outer membrane protein